MIKIIGDSVVCHAKQINSKYSQKRLLKGIVLEVIEFKNSLGMKDCSYKVEFEDGLIKEIKERLIIHVK